MLKLLSRTICILVLFTGVALSQPAQRIIIGFKSPLTEQQQTQVQQSLEQLLDQPLQLINNNNPQRWVVALTKPMAREQLQDAIVDIQSLPNVHYAELDRLLHTH